MTPTTLDPALFGGCFYQTDTPGDVLRYALSPRLGRGVMTLRQVLPGVQLIFQSFHAKSCFCDTAALLPDMLEVNYCLSGRYECELPNRSFVYMGPQDMVINPLLNRMRSSSFPLEEYSGVALLLDLTELSQNDALFGFLDIGADALRRRYCLPGQCQIRRADPTLRRLFEELAAERPAQALRLPVLNLLSQLCHGAAAPAGSRPYYPRSLIEAVKAARTALLADPGGHTLAELAAENGLSRRALIDGFHGVYGETPYAYARRYRIHCAAARLETPGVSVSEAAAEAGYQNASKFSSAFRAVMGVSPSAYRKTFCTFGAIPSLTE